MSENSSTHNAERAIARPGRQPGAGPTSIKATTSPAGPSGTHRLSVRVSNADTWMDQWWVAQDHPSASVRLLLRRFVAEHGMSDAFDALINTTPVPAVPDAPTTTGSHA